MKYIFYIVLIAFIYRVIFRPKVIIEHRHIHDKKPKENPPQKKGDFTDYEEVK
jgi:uncharacterized membrane protein YfcA